MPTYPLPQKSKYSYRENPRAWRSPRLNGRLHPGIDLYAVTGTPVYACEAGTVIAPEGFGPGHPNPYPFVRYDPKAPFVDAIEIRTTDGRIMRYCEMRFLPGIRTGKAVTEGELLGHLERMPGLTAPGDCMLHFELYRGTGKGPLTQGTVPLMRRDDILDPTAYMDSCEVKASR